MACLVVSLPTKYSKTSHWMSLDVTGNRAKYNISIHICKYVQPGVFIYIYIQYISTCETSDQFFVSSFLASVVATASRLHGSFSPPFLGFILREPVKSQSKKCQSASGWLTLHPLAQPGGCVLVLRCYNHSC